MENFFRNYQELIESNNFIEFQKKLSNLLDIELSSPSKEVKTVAKWISILGEQSFNYNGFRTNINSLFIHGYQGSQEGSRPSGVEFDFYSKTQNRELADIIFISSFYFKNKKVLEKVTFNQAKWGEVKRTTSSWNIEKGQLYLLSRLPRFTGVKNSIISNKDYYIDNISKCLTSYGLMTKENFIFISTNYLLTAIRGKASVNLQDFQALNNLNKNVNFSILYDDVLYYYLYKHRRNNMLGIDTFSKLLGNSSTYFTNNTFEFLSEYLKGNIGEITDNSISKNFNLSAKNLMSDIIQNINSIARAKNDEEAKEFIKNYRGSDDIITNDSTVKELYNDLGIIQINIDLGEI